MKQCSSKRPSARIEVSTTDCSGCLACMTVCSLVNEGYSSLSGARVRVELSPFEGKPEITVCRQCAKAACIEACPAGAIGRVAGFHPVVDYEKCRARADGCRACIEQCPFHAMFWNVVSEKVVKCELCRGDPQCVKACATGALSLKPLPDQSKATELRGDGG
jgi:Fe-S-cluster-containing hydrogenase component 2